MGPVNRADLSKRTDAVASMFDQVAPRYDLANDILALGQTRGWRRAVTSAVGAAPGERVLDVAAGTGTSSEPFVDAGAEVVAVDLSALLTGDVAAPDVELGQEPLDLVDRARIGVDLDAGDAGRHLCLHHSRERSDPFTDVSGSAWMPHPFHGPEEVAVSGG